MANQRRCISNEILYNDNFVRLPASAKILYVYINNQTDDKGFCDNVASIMRTVNARSQDLHILIEKRFVIQVNEWLYLEKHFFINNKGLRTDRLKASRYEEYLKDYTLKENGAYTLTTNCQQLSTNCQPNDGLTKLNITKHNITKVNINKPNTPDELKAALRGQQ